MNFEYVTYHEAKRYAESYARDLSWVHQYIYGNERQIVHLIQTLNRLELL